MTVRVWSVVLLLAGGCGDSIVGAVCAEGYEIGDGTCVPVAFDGSMDGGVDDGGLDGAVDGAMDGAVDGAIDGSLPLDGSTGVDGGLDGSLMDGAVPDGSLRDGSLRDGSLPDGSVPDGAVLDGSLRDGSLRDGSSRDGSFLDGSFPDGSFLDGSFPDGSFLDGSFPDGSLPDGGVLSCDLGELNCGGVCVRPETDPQHCGSCFNMCASGDVCVNGICSPICPPGLLVCGPLCIDPMGNDPDNCGGCGRRCASGICVAGVCAAAAVGHVTVVGHDYTVGRVGMNRIAGNAVFLGAGAPVRVAVYEGTATAASIAGVDRAVNQVASERGRSWTRTTVSAADLLVELATSDALVILPQTLSTDAELKALGSDLRVGLASFLRRGGAIVLFDTPSAQNLGTWQVLDSAMLFAATGLTEVIDSNIDLVNAADAVAIGVPPLYRGETNSVSFATTESTVVSSHASGPVVIHRVVIP